MLLIFCDICIHVSLKFPFIKFRKRNVLVTDIDYYCFT